MVVNTLEIFGRASLPCALFVLGASLSIFRTTASPKIESVSGKPEKNDSIAQTAVIVIIKLLLHPLLV
jgi:predicted permease